MSKTSFAPEQRYAIYTVHGESCYLCEEPLDMGSLHVDHIIPERLLDDPDELASVLTQLSLPADFDVNSYANLKPAHGKCNLIKTGKVFRATPMIQLQLDDAAAKAGKVEKAAAKTRSNKDVLKAISVITQADTAGMLTEDQIEAIAGIMSFQESVRPPELKNSAFMFSPLLKVLRVENKILHLVGPSGLIGQRPIGHNLGFSWDCPSCFQQTAWAGVRCILCGQMSDD